MTDVTNDELTTILEGIVIDAIESATGERPELEMLDRIVGDLEIDSMILVDILAAIEDDLDEELDDELLQGLIGGGSIRAMITTYVERHATA
jgi:acyl carrier protein